MERPLETSFSRRNLTHRTRSLSASLNAATSGPVSHRITRIRPTGLIAIGVRQVLVVVPAQIRRAPGWHERHGVQVRARRPAPRRLTVTPPGAKTTGDQPAPGPAARGSTPYDRTVIRRCTRKLLTVLGSAAVNGAWRRPMLPRSCSSSGATAAVPGSSPPRCSPTKAEATASARSMVSGLAGTDLEAADDR